MRKQLDDRHVPSFHGYLGMWQILNGENLAQKVNRYLKSLSKNFGFEVHQNTWQLHGLEKSYELAGSPTIWPERAWQ
jgi:hypothetical protein